MAGIGSSSRTKSSKKKREKSRSKKKSWKKEPKRRRHDSVSSFSDGDSPDSERPVRSRSKGRRRKNRKRIRHCSVSSYSDYHSVSSDSVSLSSSDKQQRRSKSKKVRVRSTVRKRKRSDRDHVSKQSRKKSSRKKYKKNSSESSYSDSESCSTSSSGDGNRKRKRATADDDNEKKSEGESYMDQKKHNAIDHVMDIPAETNSRRLRSVIAVPDYQSADENVKDSCKEEILYDQDDYYPSPKSVDSDEDRYKMGSSVPLHDNSGVLEIGKSVSGDDCEEEEDMETILRLRALENFRKYRAGCINGRQKGNGMSNGSADEPPSVKLGGGSGIPELKQSSDESLLQKANSEKMEIPTLPETENFKENPTLMEFSEKGKVVSSLEQPVSGIDVKTVTGPGSSSAPVTGEGRTEQGDKAKDASQFQQKTMSVMRGGEMVEVSYKVYIPKKAPALARRKLRH